MRASSRAAAALLASGSLALLAGAPADARLSARSKLTTDGLGPVKVGMTLARAERAAGGRFRVNRNAGGANCFIATLRGGPRGVYFFGTEQRIATVNAGRGSRVRTPSGARVGTSEGRVKSLFPGRIRVTPHKYTKGGHYLTFVPRDKADANRRIVFETDGRKVTIIRAGRLPEVGYVEGCA